MRQLLAIVAALAVTACGPSLGKYDFVDLTEVADLPMAIRHSRDPEPYLQIDLLSEFDLVADTNGNIYAFKVTCSWIPEEERMIFGPLAAGGVPRDLLDARPAMPRNETGEAHYLLYLPLSAPVVGSDSVEKGSQPYDLRTGENDLCIQIKQMGYYLTESSSQMIRISAKDLATVFER